MSRHRNFLRDYDEDDIRGNYDDEDDDDFPSSAAQVKKKKPKKKAQQPSPETPAKAPVKPSTTSGNVKQISSSTSKPSVLSIAEQQNILRLRDILGESVEITNEDLKNVLEKNAGRENDAMEELLEKFSKNMTFCSTIPQSAFTKAMEERPKFTTKQVPPKFPETSQNRTQKQEEVFDFSSPSPDDEILEARKRQERNVPVLVAGGNKKSSSASTGAGISSLSVKQESSKKTKKEVVELDDDEKQGKKPSLSLIVIGHVDAGKSTLMGHLLYDLDLVSKKDMHKFETESKKIGKASFKYAWVMDEHAEERERGVTVDVGVKRFETMKRKIVLLDAPGHQDFVPNMITGAYQADCALLVVPASVGEFESSFVNHGQTKEHAVLVHRLGVQKLLIAVNKMDSCDWSEHRFQEIKTLLEEFLFDPNVGYQPENVLFLPCSGLTGDNLVNRSEKVPSWVPQKTVVTYLDELPPAKKPLQKPLRIIIADTYKSIALGGSAVGGKILSGRVKVGDQISVRPLDLIAKVLKISLHGEFVDSAKAGENVEIGLQCKQDPDFFENLGRPGIILCDPKNVVPAADKILCEIQTLSIKYPLIPGKNLIFHVHSVQIPCVLLTIHKTLGEESKDKPRLLKSNESAEVTLSLNSKVCLERNIDFKPLSRFLLRFSGQTVAFGTVSELLPSNHIQTE